MITCPECGIGRWKYTHRDALDPAADSFVCHNGHAFKRYDKPIISNADLVDELLSALVALLDYANRYSDEMTTIGRGAEQLGAGADSESVAAAARRAINKALGVQS